MSKLATDELQQILNLFFSRDKSNQALAIQLMRGLSEDERNDLKNIFDLNRPIFSLIENCFKYYDHASGLYKNFKLSEKQTEIIFALETNKYNVINKSRQVGGTTLLLVYYAAKAVLSTGKPKTIAIIGRSYDLAKRKLKIVRDFLEQVPPVFWGQFYDYSKQSDGHIIGKGLSETLNLCNGVTIKALPDTQDALRSWTPSDIFIDEAAYNKNQTPDIFIGCNATLLSTPNVDDNFFKNIYLDAKAGLNNFNPIDFLWYHDNRYNKKLTWEDENGNQLKETEYTLQSIDKKISKGYKPTSNWYNRITTIQNLSEDDIRTEVDAQIV